MRRAIVVGWTKNVLALLIAGAMFYACIADCRDGRAYKRCQRVETFDCRTRHADFDIITRCDWRCLDAERAP